MKMNAISAYTLKPLPIMLAYAALIPYTGTMLLVTSHIHEILVIMSILLAKQQSGALLNSYVMLPL